MIFQKNSILGIHTYLLRLKGFVQTEMSGWKMMARHLFIGTINGHQFVVTTSGTIKREQHYSAKRLVTNRVHSLAKDRADKIQWPAV